MKKPILFNSKAVKATLEGRKTVTRKVIDLDLGLADMDKNDSNYLKIPDEYGDFHDAKDLCPYSIGDTLYVRETWLKADDGLFYYKASETEISKEIREDYGYKWKASIHMPKEAARIFLEVTDVRVERLKDICKDYNNFIKEGIVEEHGFRSEMHREFVEGWDGRAGKNKNWENNPYVWVIDFKRSPTTEELIENALRYKPERIVIHESKPTGEEI